MQLRRAARHWPDVEVEEPVCAAAPELLPMPRPTLAVIHAARTDEQLRLETDLLGMGLFLEGLGRCGRVEAHPLHFVPAGLPAPRHGMIHDVVDHEEKGL